MPRFASMSKDEFFKLSKIERDELRREAKAWGYGSETYESSDEERLQAPATVE